MKIAVLVKRVPDTASVIKISGGGKSIETGSLKYVLSPYDEHAVEQAIQLKESGGAEVVIVCAGGESSREIIRVALAMGADSGLLVKDDAFDAAGSRGAAEALAAAVKNLGADLVLAGKQAVDDDASQVAERVAELLDIPHVSTITKFELQGDKVAVTREIEGGQAVCEVPLPALFTAQKGLNTPRYPKLPDIMKAKKKEIKDISTADLGVGADVLSAGYELMGLHPPKERGGGRVVGGAAELVKILHEDEKLI